MNESNFPPIETAQEDGLLAFGGELSTPILLEAYQSGIFPWPTEDSPLLWFAPPKRAILRFENLHLSTSLKKFIKNSSYQFKINTCFDEVIHHCANPDLRKDQHGTWITPEMMAAYKQFHSDGYAMSFEAFNEGGQLIGGLYGVKIKKFFAAESMFHLENNASKWVLAQTIDYFKKQGLNWMDIQIMSPLLESFGAEEIPRGEFSLLLKNCLKD